MLRKSNLARASLSACTLLLLLSSTAWAGLVNVHVSVPIVHVKPPVIGRTGVTIPTGRSGSQSGGFREGDPNQPYIVGNVYNGNGSPKGAASQKTRVVPRIGVRCKVC
jgi:hypothetical protein